MLRLLVLALQNEDRARRQPGCVSREKVAWGMDGRNLRKATPFGGPRWGVC